MFFSKSTQTRFFIRHFNSSVKNGMKNDIIMKLMNHEIKSYKTNSIYSEYGCQQGVLSAEFNNKSAGMLDFEPKEYFEKNNLLVRSLTFNNKSAGMLDFEPKEYFEKNNRLLMKNEKNVVRIVNSLWAKEPSKIYDTYIRFSNICDTSYRGQINNDEINKWVDESTYGKIKSIDVVSDSDFVGINASYFKGYWEKAFDKKNNKNLPFYIDKRRSVIKKIL